MCSLYIYSIDGNYETSAQYTYAQAQALWAELNEMNVDATIINRS